MKTQNLKVRITEEEKKKLDKFCNRNGIRISEYIRTLINNTSKKEIKIITSKEVEVFSEISYELQKVGTNINQIAHYFNLEHLKSLDKELVKIEDVIMIDKCKEEQLDNIKDVLNVLADVLNNLTDKLSDYDKK